MDKKLIKCKACQQIIANSAKLCPHCGAKITKPVYTKWWFWLIIIIVVGIAAGSSSGNNEKDVDDSSNPTVSTNEKIDVFAGDPGISVTAEMGTDIIGQPTVTVSIKNTTSKDISAIKFYAKPLNVYGEELDGIFTQNELITDDTIPAGKSASRKWQFLDNDVKKVKLYVYSVYFADGTEWGDREATKSVILKNALEVQVDGISEK